MENNENNLNNTNEPAQATANPAADEPKTEPANWEQVLNAYSDPTDTSAEQQSATQTAVPVAEETPVVQLDQPAQEQAFTQQNQQPVYDANTFAYSDNVIGQVAPIKKKNPALIAIIIVLVLGVLIGGFTFLYMNDMIPFLSKGSSYEKAERGFFTQMGQTLDTATDATAKQATYDTEFSVTVSDKLQSLMNADGISLGTTNITSKIIVDNDKISMDSAFKSNDEAYLSLKTWVENNKIIAQCPELSTLFMYADVADMTSAAQNVTSAEGLTNMAITSMRKLVSDSETASALDISGKLAEAMKNYKFDQDKFNIMMDKFADEYFKIIGDGEVEKGVSDTVEGITYKADKYTFKIDMKVALQLVKAFINASLENDNIMGLIKEIGIENDYKALPAQFDTLLEKLETENSNMEILTMNVYIQNGVIIGRDITAGALVGTDLKLSYMNVSDKEKFAQKLTVTADGNTITLSNIGTVADEAYTGKMSLNSGESDIATIDYNQISLKNNKLNGSATLKIPTANNLDLSFSAISEDKNESLTVDFSMNGEKYVSVSAKSVETAGGTVTIPELNDSNSVEIGGNADENSAAVQQFITEVQTNAMSLAENIGKLKNPDIIAITITGLFVNSGILNSSMGPVTE